MIEFLWDLFNAVKNPVIVTLMCSWVLIFLIVQANTDNLKKTFKTFIDWDVYIYSLRPTFFISLITTLVWLLPSFDPLIKEENVDLYIIFDDFAFILIWIIISLIDNLKSSNSVSSWKRYFKWHSQILALVILIPLILLEAFGLF